MCKVNRAENAAYLFVHFIHDEERIENSEQVYFSISKDGLR